MRGGRQGRTLASKITKNYFEGEDGEIQYKGSTKKRVSYSPLEGIASKRTLVKQQASDIDLMPLQQSKPATIDFQTYDQPEQKVEPVGYREGKKKPNINAFDIESSEEQNQQRQELQMIKLQPNKRTERQRQTHQQIQSIDLNVDSPPQDTEENLQRLNHNISRPNNEAGHNEPSAALNFEGATKFEIRRDTQWLNKIWPQFNIHYHTSNKFFASAKQTGNNTALTFLLSKNNSDFQENNSSYLGKVKANFTGSIVNIYGPGYNPSDYNSKKQPIRQILATVQYESNLFGQQRPRNMRAFVLKPGVSYYFDLKGPQPGEEQIPLNQLYQKSENKNKILVMINRKPKWNQKLQRHVLVFGGKVRMPSIKNFILEDEDNPQNTRVLFGKTNENSYRLEIMQPLTPLAGIGIAMSAFGHKIGCQ